MGYLKHNGCAKANGSKESRKDSSGLNESRYHYRILKRVTAVKLFGC